MFDNVISQLQPDLIGIALPSAATSQGPTIARNKWFPARRSLRLGLCASAESPLREGEPAPASREGSPTEEIHLPTERLASLSVGNYDFDLRTAPVVIVHL